jgi:hypothetical protein
VAAPRMLPHILGLFPHWNCEEQLPAHQAGTGPNSPSQSGPSFNCVVPGALLRFRLGKKGASTLWLELNQSRKLTRI